MPGFADPFKTKIDVAVCGLTKFIVQNDESLQDVNGPVFPFGTRPEVIDFNVVSPSYCLTEELITDSLQAPNAISADAEKALKHLLKPDVKKFRIAKHALKTWLDQTFVNPGPPVGSYQLTPDEKTKLEGLFKDITRNYCKSNLVGPNFYIGSKEVFAKNGKMFLSILTGKINLPISGITIRPMWPGPMKPIRAHSYMASMKKDSRSIFPCWKMEHGLWKTFIMPHRMQPGKIRQQKPITENFSPMVPRSKMTAIRQKLLSNTFILVMAIYHTQLSV